MLQDVVRFFRFLIVAFFWVWAFEFVVQAVTVWWTFWWPQPADLAGKIEWSVVDVLAATVCTVIGRAAWPRRTKAAIP